MALDVFFAEDVRRILGGLLETASESEMDAPKFDGYLLAIRSVARAFGIDAPTLPKTRIIDAEARQLGTGHKRRNGGQAVTLREERRQ